MSISQDIPIYSDINTWNQTIQSSAIDPNTFSVTPPHTHLRNSATDNMSIWEENTIPIQQTWDSPIHPQNTADDASIAVDFQAQEFSAAMNVEAGIDGERPERPPRRPREYGMSLSSHSITPFLPLVVSFVVIFEGFWCHLTLFRTGS